MINDREQAADGVLTAKPAPHRPILWDGFEIRPTRHRPGAFGLSMNTQRLFGDEDLQLIEFTQQRLFELSDESRAALTAKIQSGHDDDLIEIEPSTALPDSLQWEFPLLSGQTAKPGQQAVLHALKEFI